MNTEHYEDEHIVDATGVVGSVTYSIEGLSYGDLTSGVTLGISIPTGATARVTGTIPQASISGATTSPDAYVTVNATLNAFD